jgi:hypothetical protein
MKRTKLSILALAVLAGGTLAASAAAVPTVVQAYSLSISFTNAQAQYWSVDTGPFTTNVESATAPAFFGSGISTSTDGSGKITGAGILSVLNNTVGSPASQFAVNVSGKISATTAAAGTPTVSLTVKGKGYTVNSNGVPTAANISLTFKSSVVADNNNRFPGTLTGTVSGLTPGVKAATKITAQGAFVRASSQFASIDTDIVQSMKGTSGKLVIFSSDTAGSGSVKAGGYTLNGHGTGHHSASSMSVKGTEGSYTNNVFASTNTIVFSAPTTAAIVKGKLSGQAVTSAAASSVNANLITGF